MTKPASHSHTTGDPPGVEPSGPVMTMMRAVADRYGAVEYDRHDRPEEIDAVLAAAHHFGVVPIPSDAVQPRTFRGADLPDLDITPTGCWIRGVHGEQVPADREVWERAARRVGHPTPTTRPAAGVGVQHQVDLVLDAIRPILTAALTEATQRAGDHATETPAAAWSRGYDAGAAAPRYEIPPAGTGG